MSTESTFQKTADGSAERATTVLIIEDNPANRDVAEQMLDLARYPHISTDNVEDAWRTLKAGGVLLVVSDLHLNAVSLIERMRADPRTAEIPVIIASGDRSADAEQAAMDAGAQSYINKPFTYEKLTATIRRCLPPREA